MATTTECYRLDLNPGLSALEQSSNYSPDREGGSSDFLLSVQIRAAVNTTGRYGGEGGEVWWGWGPGGQGALTLW